MPRASKSRRGPRKAGIPKPAFSKRLIQCVISLVETQGSISDFIDEGNRRTAFQTFLDRNRGSPMLSKTDGQPYSLSTIEKTLKHILDHGFKPLTFQEKLIQFCVNGREVLTDDYKKVFNCGQPTIQIGTVVVDPAAVPMPALPPQNPVHLAGQQQAHLSGAVLQQHLQNMHAHHRSVQSYIADCTTLQHKEQQLNMRLQAHDFLAKKLKYDQRIVSDERKALKRAAEETLERELIKISKIGPMLLKPAHFEDFKIVSNDPRGSFFAKMGKQALLDAFGKITRVMPTLPLTFYNNLGGSFEDTIDGLRWEDDNLVFLHKMVTQGQSSTSTGLEGPALPVPAISYLHAMLSMGVFIYGLGAKRPWTTINQLIAENSSVLARLKTRLASPHGEDIERKGFSLEIIMRDIYNWSVGEAGGPFSSSIASHAESIAKEIIRIITPVLRKLQGKAGCTDEKVFSDSLEELEKRLTTNADWVLQALAKLESSINTFEFFIPSQGATFDDKTMSCREATSKDTVAFTIEPGVTSQVGYDDNILVGTAIFKKALVAICRNGEEILEP